MLLIALAAQDLWPVWRRCLQTAPNTQAFQTKVCLQLLASNRAKANLVAQDVWPTLSCPWSAVHQSIWSSECWPAGSISLWCHQKPESRITLTLLSRTDTYWYHPPKHIDLSKKLCHYCYLLRREGPDLLFLKAGSIVQLEPIQTHQTKLICNLACNQDFTNSV